MTHRLTVSEAYATLGVEVGASTEVIKSAYKQLALKTHPDKNPGDADATTQFQKVSAAYDTLVRHLDRPSGMPSGHPRAHSHFHPFGYEDEDYDDDDDYFEDDYDDFYHESEYDDLGFYRFLFEEMLRGRSNQYAHEQYYRSHPHPHHYHYTAPAPETDEQRTARLRRAREEQEQAEQRRAAEEATRKANREKERQQNRHEAEQRKRKKASAKKAAAEASRKAAENKARSQQEQLQSKRSNVFAAARRNDTDAVKKGVWEDEVDASGGETRKGSELFMKSTPADSRETLMHIAAKHGNLDLVEWLDSHGAEADERNGKDMTAFHEAIKAKRMKTVAHFFENYPPSDEDHASIYRSPRGSSNLRLALDTKEPEIVWRMLDKQLFTRGEIDEAWTFVTCKTFQSKLASQDKYEELVNLLTSFGGFSLPEQNVNDSKAEASPPPASTLPSKPNGYPRRPEPTVNLNDLRSHTTSPVSATSESVPTPTSATQSNNSVPRVRGRHPHRGSFRPFYQHQGVPSPASPDAESIPSPKVASFNDGPPPHSPNYRGRGRGGRGHFRGRGRGRGRGGPPASVQNPAA